MIHCYHQQRKIIGNESVCMELEEQLVSGFLSGHNLLLLIPVVIYNFVQFQVMISIIQYQLVFYPVAYIILQHR